ncbi:hypothetical protein [Alsobacter sp. R-9]
MIVRSLFVIVALALAGLILWAFGQAPFWASVARVVADPWGLVMLGDLYAGFLATTALFFLFERPLVAVLLFVALMVLGNVVTLLWLAARGWSLLKTRLA